MTKENEAVDSLSHAVNTLNNAVENLESAVVTSEENAGQPWINKENMQLIGRNLGMDVSMPDVNEITYFSWKGTALTVAIVVETNEVVAVFLAEK